jgi:hypothetical protein
MTRRLASLALLLLIVTAAAAPVLARDYSRQVVEISVTYQRHDPRQPWLKGRPYTRSAMAVVIDGSRLLTSAQMVSDATLVRAQKFGSPPKVAARVIHVDNEANLALLSVDDPTFFEGLEPVRLQEELPVQGTVNSVRWRSGQFEVSESRIVRIEVLGSPVGALRYACLRVKSDLGGGGWAEPVFLEDRLVGLTFTAGDDLSNVLPADLIDAYLQAAGVHGEYGGFGSLGISWKQNRDRALSSYLGLSGEARGVLVVKVPWGSSAWGVLQPRDILLSLGGYAIDAEGFYEHPRYGRLHFDHIPLEGRLAGDRLTVKVLREKKELALEMTLRRYPTAERLVPGRRSDYAPPYLIAGGLVFREFDLDYLSSWGKEWQRKADTRLLTIWDLEEESQADDRRRIVILAYVLPSPYNVGYHDLRNLPVQEVNGRPVDSLHDLEEGLRDSQEGFHQIRFIPNEIRNEVILDAEGIKAATEEILSTYGIPEPARF